MDFRNCVRCGKLFTYTTKPICDDCARKEEEEFMQIKEFVSENPNTSLAAISEETGVSVNRLMKYLREGRLELLSAEESGMLSCEHCGKPISTGRYCESCYLKINNTINELFTPEQRGGGQQKSSGSRMYTYDKDRKR